MRTSLRRIRVLRGHTEHARFNALLRGPVGEIPARADIPSPWSYSAEWPVFALALRVGAWPAGTHVLIRETRHARYEVFEVPHV
jgi:hypothetical protein